MRYRGGLVVGLMLALSGIAVGQTTRPHDFARWEKEVAAYEHADQEKPPAKGGIVFTGASTIKRWTTLQVDFPGVNVINRGFGGTDIEDATHFADRLIFPYQPKAVYIRSGGNDLHNGKSVERVVADYKAFVAAVRAKLPDARIVFISLSPSLARWEQHEQEKAVNEGVQQFTESGKNLGYIEVYDIVLGPDGKPREDLFVADHLHFNAEGYKLLVERVRPYIQKEQ